MSTTKTPRVQGTPDAKQLGRYGAGFTLIPLHKPRDLMKLKGGKTKEVGKAPLDPKWTTKAYDSAKVRARCIKEERNAGVRLTDEQLVIDVDPRNGGEAGFAALCHDIGIDGDAFPRVITGSGGFHCYMQKPADVLIRDTLESDDYDGVEFKSRGRQVVAAGSIHPNGNPYAWSEEHPDIADGLPPAPKALLKAIKRPPRSAVQGGGQYSQEQIAEALSKLDVTQFNSNDKWFQLMQACHHASGGDARSEFLDWSTSDSAYAADAYLIGKRWDSLHADRNDGVTYRTLNMILRENGAASSQAAPEVDADEFPDDQGDDMDFDTPASDDMTFEADDAPALSPEYAEFDMPDDGVAREGMPDESISKLDELNRDYCGVFANGRYRIMTLQENETGRRWSASSKQDFVSAYENIKIERDMTGLSKNAQSIISLGEAWQTWPRRNTARSTCFDTTAAPGLIDGARLNLWTGFAIEPKRGDCRLFKAMIRDDLCAGDAKVNDYVIKWIAWKLQNPGLLPGVGIVFVGNIGVGKTTLGETIAGYFGNHGLCVDDIDAVTGKFNGHLESVCFVYIDEAMWGGDKKRVGPMKKLISDKEKQYQYKGVDTFRGINRAGVMMGSNEDWVIPAGKEERRYCVSRVSADHYAPTNDSADSPNRKYWNAVHAELNGGGRAAFLFDMLAMKLGDWTPYGGDVPSTQAMAEQKFQGLDKVDRWYHQRLLEGTLPGGDEAIIQPRQGGASADAWAKAGFHLHPTIVANDYREWYRFINTHANVSDGMVLKDLKRYGWTGGGDYKVRGQRAWDAPSLGEARRLFGEALGHATLFE